MDSIEKLTKLFSQFPTIGSRTAGRFVFYLISQPKEKIDELVAALQDLQKNTKLCQFCFNPFERDDALCDICRDASRNNEILCVVEKVTDLLSIEKTKKYKGRYFILGGAIGLRKNMENLRVEPLKKRVKEGAFKEIIIAFNMTPEGKATSVLVERMLSENFKLKVTHLAQGIPVGGELEYADEETLESAFEGRK